MIDVLVPFGAGVLVGTAAMWVFTLFARLHEADQWDRDRWRR